MYFEMNQPVVILSGTVGGNATIVKCLYVWYVCSCAACVSHKMKMFYIHIDLFCNRTFSDGTRSLYPPHPPLTGSSFCTDVSPYAHIRSYSRLVPPEWPSPPHHLPARETFVTTGAFQTNGVLRRGPPTLHGATTNLSCLTFASGAGGTPRSAWRVCEHAI